MSGTRWVVRHVDGDAYLSDMYMLEPGQRDAKRFDSLDEARKAAKRYCGIVRRLKPRPSAAVVEALEQVAEATRAYVLSQGSCARLEDVLRALDEARRAGGGG